MKPVRWMKRGGWWYFVALQATMYLSGVKPLYINLAFFPVGNMPFPPVQTINDQCLTPCHDQNGSNPTLLDVILLNRTPGYRIHPRSLTSWVFPWEMMGLEDKDSLAFGAKGHEILQARILLGKKSQRFVATVNLVLKSLVHPPKV